MPWGSVEFLHNVLISGRAPGSFVTCVTMRNGPVIRMWAAYKLAMPSTTLAGPGNQVTIEHGVH